MNLREIGRPLLWFVIGLAVAAVPLLLLRDSQQRETVVRSYSVAPDISREMQSALDSALGARTKDGPRVGSVSQAPDGRILVAAPESVQKGVQDILTQVAATKPPATPTIHFEVWLVTAVPGASAADVEPDLAEVRPALADIQKLKGPLHFELIEDLALQTRAGNNRNEVKGARAELRVTTSLRNDAKGQPVIAANINVQQNYRQPLQIGEISALTELRPGQLLVIGQSTVPGKTPTDRNSQIYFIVRASL
jgi:hypothetical protein